MQPELLHIPTLDRQESSERNPPLIEVPVTAHIKNFVDRFFGNPVVLNDTTSHLIAMKVFLSYNMQMDLFFQHEPLKPMPNTVYLQIVRKKYMDIRIKKQNIQQIVKYFDRIFEEQMHQYVQTYATKQSHTTGYKHQIEAFCKIYGIELFQDISEDAICKQYYRYREVLQIMDALNKPKLTTVAA